MSRNIEIEILGMLVHLTETPQAELAVEFQDAPKTTAIILTLQEIIRRMGDEQKDQVIEKILPLMEAKDGDILLARWIMVCCSLPEGDLEKLFSAAKAAKTKDEIVDEDIDVFKRFIETLEL